LSRIGLLAPLNVLNERVHRAFRPTCVSLWYTFSLLCNLRGRPGDGYGDCNGQHRLSRTHRASPRHGGRSRRNRAKGRSVQDWTSAAKTWSPTRLRTAKGDTAHTKACERMAAGDRSLCALRWTQAISRMKHTASLK